MSTLFWQLAWAGPRMQDPGWPGPPVPVQGWAVMPDPAQGDAWVACVPVEDRDGRIVVAVANAQAPVPTIRAPLNQWTTVVPPESGGWSAVLCLLGYDQPGGQLGGAFVQQPVQTLALGLLDGLGLHPRPTAMRARTRGPNEPVTADELQQVIDNFHQHTPTALRGQVIRPPTLPPRMTPDRVSFAFASCQYPAGFMDRVPAEASYGRLACHLESGAEPVPSMLLLVGDQIYADATAGLIDPVRLDDRYRVPYEEWLRIEPLRRIMGRIPVRTMLDDHEITDNWEPYRPGARGREFEHGVHAYWEFQRMSQQRRSRQMLRRRTWFKLRNAVEGWSLFVADSRTRRDWRVARTLASAEILGPHQMQQLRHWLVDPVRRDDLKLIATPAMLLPRLIEHQDAPLHLDNWQGYPASLHGLLAHICDEGVRDVCFLSGDAHLGCDVRIQVTRADGKQANIRSIHSPALYAPMPFANEQLHNLALRQDRFSFGSGASSYTCDVDGQAFLPLRDGFCLLEAERMNNGWDIRCKVL